MNSQGKLSVPEKQSFDHSLPERDRDENQLLVLRGLFLRRNELLKSKQPESNKARAKPRK